MDTTGCGVVACTEVPGLHAKGESMSTATQMASGLTSSFMEYLKALLVKPNDHGLVCSEAVTLFAKCFHAYQECDEQTQDIARRMVDIITNPATDEDDRLMAAHTLAEALFPGYDEKLGINLEEAEKACAENSAEGAEAIADLDRQEASFAERLDNIMRDKDISQTELASRTGVNQSAISMMLKRQCRPQQRTILKLANALGVQPGELWPTD
jgi:lambda repressor-like predicted transcriptional regulator